MLNTNTRTYNQTNPVPFSYFYIKTTLFRKPLALSSKLPLFWSNSFGKNNVGYLGQRYIHKKWFWIVLKINRYTSRKQIWILKFLQTDRSNTILITFCQNRSHGSSVVESWKPIQKGVWMSRVQTVRIKTVEKLCFPII